MPLNGHARPQKNNSWDIRKWTIIVFQEKHRSDREVVLALGKCAGFPSKIFRKRTKPQSKIIFFRNSKISEIQ